MLSAKRITVNADKYSDSAAIITQRLIASEPRISQLTSKIIESVLCIVFVWMCVRVRTDERAVQSY